MDSALAVVQQHLQFYEKKRLLESQTLEHIELHGHFKLNLANFPACLCFSSFTHLGKDFGKAGTDLVVESFVAVPVCSLEIWLLTTQGSLLFAD